MAVSGCGGFLPDSGPGRQAVLAGPSVSSSGAGQPALQYALVTLNPVVTATLAAAEDKPSLLDMPAGAPAGLGLIGVGDVIGVTVFEASSGGLFLPGDQGTHEGNFVHLPNQEVDRTGSISVPFAGRVKAAGHTPQSVQRGIEHALAGRALEPQVIVTIVERHADAVSVLGDVGTSTRFPLDAGGEHLLGALARAGGPKHAPYETMIMVQRRSRTARVLLSDVARDPAQNIQLEPGDTVFVSYEPRYFLALGATGQGTSLGPVNRRFAFEDASLSLADAIAKAGGLQDDRANARAVFLYRLERRATLSSLGVETTGDPASGMATIYALDLTDPAGLFHASQVPMHDKDLVFVSNAPATDIGKFLSLILPTASSVSGFNTGVR